MNKLIIFVQASRDLQYALWLYNKNKGNHVVEFYVIDHSNNFDYLKSLSLQNCRIHFIGNHSLKSVKTLLSEKVRLNRLYRKYFSDLKDIKVIFFSNYFDIKTFYFVSRLSYSNEVVFYDHYKLHRKLAGSRSLHGWARVYSAYLATGKFFQLSKDQKVLVFDYKKYNIGRVEVDSSAVDIGELAATPSPGRKSVVLFDSNDAFSLNIKNYRGVVERLIQFLLDKGFSVYVKPHPRLGCSKFLHEYPIQFLSAETPVELIDFSQFDYIFGNVSAALCGCEPAKGVISFLRLLEFEKVETGSDYEGYLSGLGGNILFPETYEKLTKVVED